MAQLSIRLDDGLAQDLRRYASARRVSVNAAVLTAIRALTDPEAQDGESQRVREYLLQAGILSDKGPLPAGRERPGEDRLADARRRLTTGTPISDLIADERR